MNSSWRKDVDSILEGIEPLSLQDTILELKQGDLYKGLEGQGKNRTLFKANPKLFKSIYLHSKDLEDKMKQSGRYASAYNFSHRVKFLVEYGGDIEKLKCRCGSRYSWTGYCRHCTPAADLTPEERRRRAEVSKCTMRKKLGEEFRREGKSPRYDTESIAILNRFGKENELNLQHAEHGGEYYLQELGYWLDGYDVKKNIVVEIDEPFHFRKELVLGDRDIQRHKDIKKALHCQIYHIYFNKRTNRVVLYNSPENPDNWNVNQGKELTGFKGFAKNGTKQYCLYGEK